jgi:predicted nuclease of predicted toxin-antitoxin system
VKILLDECMPLPILASLSELGHTIQHAARCGLAGCSNGDVYDHAIAEFDLFITNDRHFRNPDRFPMSRELGIVFVRIAPCVTDLVAPPLRRLLTEVTERSLAGRRIVLRRDGWQFVE